MNATEEIRHFVKTRFGIPDTFALQNDASFLDSGVVDSTGILELISFLQERYAIKIADAEVVPENFDSIDRVVGFVSEKKAAGARSSLSMAREEPAFSPST